VARGYEAIATAEPGRVRRLEANGDPETVRAAIWNVVRQFFRLRPGGQL